MSDYISVDKLADILDVSRATIQNEIKAGKIRAIRVGSMIRIPKENHWITDPTYKSRKRSKKDQPANEVNEPDKVTEVGTEEIKN